MRRRSRSPAVHQKIPGAVLDPAHSLSLPFGGQIYNVDRWSVPCDAVGKFGFQFNMYRPVTTMPKYEILADDLKVGAWEEGGNLCATSVWGVDIQMWNQPAGILGGASLLSLLARRSSSHTRSRRLLPPLAVPLLRNVYSVFDYGSTDSAPTISFGKLA